MEISEIIALVLSSISTIAAVISVIQSLINKKEIKSLKNELSYNKITISNDTNSGSIVGINTGDIR